MSHLEWEDLPYAGSLKVSEKNHLKYAPQLLGSTCEKIHLKSDPHLLVSAYRSEKEMIAFCQLALTLTDKFIPLLALDF